MQNAPCQAIGHYQIENVGTPIVVKGKRYACRVSHQDCRIVITTAFGQQWRDRGLVEAGMLIALAAASEDQTGLGEGA